MVWQLEWHAGRIVLGSLVVKKTFLETEKITKVIL
jgi:hypothetical protein